MTTCELQFPRLKSKAKSKKRRLHETRQSQLPTKIKTGGATKETHEKYKEILKQQYLQDPIKTQVEQLKQMPISNYSRKITAWNALHHLTVLMLNVAKIVYKETKPPSKRQKYIHIPEIKQLRRLKRKLTDAIEAANRVYNMNTAKVKDVKKIEKLEWIEEIMIKSPSDNHESIEQ